MVKHVLCLVCTTYLIQKVARRNTFTIEGTGTTAYSLLLQEGTFLRSPVVSIFLAIWRFNSKLFTERNSHRVRKLRALLQNRVHSVANRSVTKEKEASAFSRLVLPVLFKTTLRVLCHQNSVNCVAIRRMTWRFLSATHLRLSA